MGKSLISDNRHPKLKLASSPSRKLLALSRHVEETETVLPKPDPRPDPRPDLRFDLASIKRARELCEMLRHSKVTQEESAKLQPRYNSKDLLERHRKLTYKGFKVEEKRAQPEGEESRSRGKAGLFESGSHLAGAQQSAQGLRRHFEHAGLRRIERRLVLASPI